MDVTDETFTMIQDCLKRTDKLTFDEIKYVEDLEFYLRNSLTPRQLKRLDDIWEKATTQ